MSEDEAVLKILQNQIKHIVVVCMENRSFDSMVGYLSIDDPSCGINGLSSNYSNPSAKFGSISVTNLSDVPIKLDPNHSAEAVIDQIDKDKTMNGFVKSYSDRFPKEDKLAISKVMGYYTQQSVPLYQYFFDQFFLCDHWFSSIAGPTTPNRAYLMAGASQFDKHGPNSSILVDQKNIHTYKSYTIFEALDGESGSEGEIFNFFSDFWNRIRRFFGKKNNNWRYYYHAGSFAQLFTFERFCDDIMGFLNEETTLSNSFYEFKHFKTDVQSGNLPKLSWIDPKFSFELTPGIILSGNDDHPPAYIHDGQKLLTDIIEAFTTLDKQHWLEIFYQTLIIVLYDEHGGFYDHVSPPSMKPNMKYPSNTLNTLGVRVPAFFISPFVKNKKDLDYKNNTHYQENKKELKVDTEMNNYYEHVTLIKTILEILKPDQKEKTFKRFSTNNDNRNIEKTNSLKYSEIFQRNFRENIPTPFSNNILIKGTEKLQQERELIEQNKINKSQTPNLFKQSYLYDPSKINLESIDSMLGIQLALFTRANKNHETKMKKFKKKLDETHDFQTLN